MSRLTEWLEQLLPTYTNNTVSSPGRLVVTTWLRSSRRGRERMAGIRALQRSLHVQTSEEPSPYLFRQIQARLEPQEVASQKRAPSLLLPSLLIVIFAISVAAIFWAVPPGIILNWTVKQGTPANFRIFRAIAGEQAPQFSLVSELAAEPDGENYQYVDFRSLPGQSYVYQVEVIDVAGRAASSQLVVGDGLQALPGQLAIILVVSIAILNLWIVRYRMTAPSIRARHFARH